MPAYRPSIVWALSPLALELGGIVTLGIGIALSKRWPITGAVVIVVGLLIWVSGFYRIRRRRT